MQYGNEARLIKNLSYPQSLFDSRFQVSNRVLRSQAICFEPQKSWKILADLPAEGRLVRRSPKGEGGSPEAVNSYHPIWLRALHAFRTVIWQIPGNISPFKIVNYW
ncbi:MAG: hypothetical protein HYT40_02030 [Candidatus Sungbacteria bacterium]|uniref:Uncharacterized protein n=1 Tax=Candidatus Sungiibacteriota bacterium TaxID=2750080 RepID=A0A931WP41_9BACT|nr:hypothetical protein [Candidatus Sungbacteria bacterium]